MASPASIGGHPIHPMIIPFPIALLIFAGSFYLRTTSGAAFVGGNYTIPLVLSIVGVILITISGWLGGEMVFKHRVAVAGGSETPPERPATSARAKVA